ncbi:MucR family transcriptional regulator [Methylobacterium sp. A54F]
MPNETTETRPIDATATLLPLASQIVASYVSNHYVLPTDLPALIATVYASLGQLELTTSSEDTRVEQPSIAQIRKSVTDDAITSFIDGRLYKTLKRHLMVHGLTPQAYRERYGLAANYPMVAPSYGRHRSALAKAIRLGHRGGMQRAAE